MTPPCRSATRREARIATAGSGTTSATPRIPEWEQVAQKVAEHLEPAIRGVATVDAALASLDKDVSALLAKRRWVLARKAAHAR